MVFGMAPSLSAARVATFVYFVLNGTLLGMWVVQIPAVEERVGISHATLGGLLVLLGGGAFLGMQVSGRLVDRLGTGVVVPAAGVLCSATLALPGLAPEPWTLGAALLIFGFGNGCLDVSMNAHAVHVEKAYARPVMSAFHATFSVGGVLAALLGAGAAGVGMTTAATLGTVAVLGVVTALVAARGLLPGAPVDDAEVHAASPVGKRAVPARIWVLAGLALVIMLCEGAANDWSALHLKSVLGAPEATAALGYGAFAAAMTVGRLLADRLTARFGPMAVLRYGSAMAAVGITIVALLPWVWAALAGWALFGLGLSGCVPQLFSAAGHADPAAAGANVSRVAGLGYLGMLAGPAVIGWLTHLVPLNQTFLLMTLLCAVAAVAAGVLRAPGQDRTREAAPSTP
ncbi:MFS transporter [Streptomyces sp. NPDC000983]|uniref:MFS transporter n=1 Tax=Streptomyces sp. NPDC000983 TaxID=3154373 RepID=UPI003319F6AA